MEGGLAGSAAAANIDGGLVIVALHLRIPVQACSALQLSKCVSRLGPDASDLGGCFRVHHDTIFGKVERDRVDAGRLLELRALQQKRWRKRGARSYAPVVTVGKLCARRPPPATGVKRFDGDRESLAS